MSVTAYIALGSNLQSPETQLQGAVDKLSRESGIQLSGCSRLYRSAPVGPAGQPDYLNAVIRITTSLAPEALLDVLQAIENRHGRVRSQHWGPRTLDLDILLYGDQQIASERLTVPHRQMTVRNFVLYPLSDLDPQLRLPGHPTSLPALLAQVGDAGLQPVADAGAWFNPPAQSQQGTVPAGAAEGQSPELQPNS